MRNSENQPFIDLIEVKKLDPGIKDAVLVLIENGIETFESCQGGKGHCFPEPTIRFWGDRNEGLRAAYIAIKNDLPVSEIRRSFTIDDGELSAPFWEMTLKAPFDRTKLSLNRKKGVFTG